MTTRDEELLRLRDELRGLLVESFAMVRAHFALGDETMAKLARNVHVQMQRSDDLFARIVKTAAPPPSVAPTKEPQKPVNGAVPTGPGVKRT